MQRPICIPTDGRAGWDTHLHVHPCCILSPPLWKSNPPRPVRGCMRRATTCECGPESHDGGRRCGSECRLQHAHLTSWAVCEVLRSTRMEQRRIRRRASPAGEASKCCPGAIGHSGGSLGGGEGTICGIDEVNFPRSPLPAVAEPGHRGGVDGIHAQPSKSKAVTWVFVAVRRPWR